MVICATPPSCARGLYSLVNKDFMTCVRGGYVISSYLGVAQWKRLEGAGIAVAGVVKFDVVRITAVRQRRLRRFRTRIRGLGLVGVRRNELQVGRSGDRLVTSVG